MLNTLTQVSDLGHRARAQLLKRFGKPDLHDVAEGCSQDVTLDLCQEPTVEILPWKKPLGLLRF